MVALVILPGMDGTAKPRADFVAALGPGIEARVVSYPPDRAQYTELEALACGRPVITQETGFTRHYGGQRGLFSFTTLEEIAEAVRAINADYKAHCRAAFEVAAEVFEAEKVLASLLERAGI